MNSSAKTFLEFDEYLASIRSAHVTGFVAGTGHFKSELQKIDLGPLWLQRGSETLPRSVHISLPTERSPILFLDDPDQAAIRLSGHEVRPDEVVFWSPEASHYQTTSMPVSWASMSLTQADLAAAGTALAGVEITAPKATQIIRPPAAAMTRLVALHRATTRLAKTAPKTLVHGEVEKSIGQRLIEAMINCITPAETDPFSRSWHQHLRIMSRFEEWLEANLERPAYLVEVCGALGVSQRTLNLCCHEHLGVSPTRYLWLRRMYQAHRALLRSDFGHVTVTNIAMDQGFWELGRFSVAYRQLFGELPKQTLRRQPSSSIPDEFALLPKLLQDLHRL